MPSKLKCPVCESDVTPSRWEVGTGPRLPLTNPGVGRETVICKVCDTALAATRGGGPAVVNFRRCVERRDTGFASEYPDELIGLFGIESVVHAFEGTTEGNLVGRLQKAFRDGMSWQGACDQCLRFDKRDPVDILRECWRQGAEAPGSRG